MKCNKNKTHYIYKGVESGGVIQSPTQMSRFQATATWYCTSYSRLIAKEAANAHGSYRV